MDETAFLSNELVQDAVIRNIEIIGEASNNLQRVAPMFVASQSHIPWQVMYPMRNRVFHAYHKVDHAIVWKTVRNDLPVLADRIEVALAALPPEDADAASGSVS